jgi:hypothetical protein
MDISRKPNGKWELRWRESGQRRSRTFDRKGDATAFEADRIRRKQLGHAAVPDDVPLREFVETYWALHAKPNLAESTRDFYARTWVNHIMPRLGNYGVRELTPKRLARFREELEKADIGAATVRKAMAIIQSILSFAVAEELIDFNPAASVRKPRYQRAREPHIFLPAEVEEIRDKLTSPRDRTLVSLLAYSGPRPEEVVCRLAWEDIGERAIRYRDTKRHRVRFTPLLAPARRGPARMVPRLRPARGKAAGHPRPRRRLLDRRRLAQLAVADLARRGTAGEPTKRPDVPGCRARRHPPARPAFELHHRSGVRRRPADDDLEAVRHQHHNDRAALRWRDREPGREAGSGGRTDPGRAGATDPPNRRHGRRDEASQRPLRARPPQS